MPPVSLLNDQFSHDFQYVLALTRYEFITYRLVHPGRANLNVGKRLARQCTSLALWQRQDGVRHRGVERLQLRKLFSFGAIQAEKRQLEGLYGRAHMSSVEYLVDIYKMFSWPRTVQTSP